MQRVKEKKKEIQDANTKVKTKKGTYKNSNTLKRGSMRVRGCDGKYHFEVKRLISWHKKNETSI